MNAVFADTFFYLALLDDTEPDHGRALAESKVSRLIVTTEFVLLELGNACARAEDHADFLALVAGMRASPRVKIIPLLPNFSIAVWRECVNGAIKTGRSLIAFRS